MVNTTIRDIQIRDKKFLGEFWTAGDLLENLPDGDTDGQLAFVFENSTPPGTGIANSIYEWDDSNTEWDFVETVIPVNDTKFITTKDPELFFYDGINSFKFFSGGSDVEWGDITGLISNQTDLIAALDAIDVGEFAGPYAATTDIPTPYDTNDLYLVGSSDPYDIYISINNTLTQIGSSSVDLSNYYNKTEADALLALKSGLCKVTLYGGVTGNFTLNSTGADISFTTTIPNQAVTTEKLMDQAVTWEKIADLTIGQNQINTSAITNSKIADNAVTTGKILNGTIMGEDIALSTITQDKLMGSATVGQVLTTTTANAAPTWVSVPSDNTKAGLSTITHPATGDVTGSFSLNANGAAISDPLTIGAGKVLSTMIADNAVTSGKLADNAVTSGKIAGSAVTADKIGASAVTETKINNFSISNVKILDSAISPAKLNAAVLDLFLPNITSIVFDPNGGASNQVVVTLDKVLPTGKLLYLKNVQTGATVTTTTAGTNPYTLTASVDLPQPFFISIE
jgi:hypothetical protein